MTAPTYDEATRTANYDAKVLADYERLGATFQEQPKGADSVHAQFGAASLYIDDCPDGNIWCEIPSDMGARHQLYDHQVGFCYDWGKVCCAPCDDQSAMVAQCNASYSECDGRCTLVTDEGMLSCIPNYGA